jgi:cobalamin biosynthesis protein CbiG
MTDATHVLGAGLASAATTDELLALVRSSLDLADVSPEQVLAVTTSDELAKDPRLAALGWPVIGIDPETLATTEVPNPSARVEQEIGVASVAEAAALVGAGPDGILVLSKQRSAHATVSIARQDG